MKNFKYIVKIALPLVVICIVTVAVLAGVNAFTAPVIEKNNAETLRNNMELFFGDGIDAKESSPAGHESSVKAVYAVSKDGAEIGYCFDVTGNGAYKGTVEVLVAVDTEGKIVGISNVKNGETPSIGGKVLRTDYFENYIGHTAQNIQKDVDIPFISGATRTSTALNNAVKNALNAYETIVSEREEPSQ